MIHEMHKLNLHSKLIFFLHFVLWSSLDVRGSKFQWTFLSKSTCSQCQNGWLCKFVENCFHNGHRCDHTLKYFHSCFSSPIFLSTIRHKVLPHQIDKGRGVTYQGAQLFWRFQRLTKNPSYDISCCFCLPPWRQVRNVGEGGHSGRPAHALKLWPQPVQLWQHDKHRKRFWCSFGHRISDGIVVNE